MSAKPAIGLYFTDYFIEVSQISNDGKRLECFGQQSLPSGCVVNGEIKDSSTLVKVLKQLLASSQPHPIKYGERVVVGVSDNRVFLREFTLSKYAGKEIEEAIDYQVRTLLPLLPSGVETDWQIIGHNAEGQIEVLLCAIPKTVIQSYLSAVSAAGLLVVAIEPAVFANIRIVKPALFRGKDQLLVYLGDSFAEFTYITNGNPRFSDHLPDSEIAKKGGINIAIRDYVVYSNSKHSTRPVREIIVSGFSSQAQDLVDKFRAQNVAAAMASSRLSTSAVKDHNLLHTSQGLSLKTLDQATSFNLLPLQFRLAMIRERLVENWKAVLNLLILLAILGSIGLVYVYRLVQVQLTLTEAQMEVYRSTLVQPKNQVLISSANNLNLLSDQMIWLRESTGGESDILRQLALVTPAGLSLTSLVYSRGPGSVKLADLKSSWAITGVAGSRQLVLDFYNKLLTQAYFANGILFFGSLEKETSVGFRIANQTKL